MHIHDNKHHNLITSFDLNMTGKNPFVIKKSTVFSKISNKISRTTKSAPTDVFPSNTQWYIKKNLSQFNNTTCIYKTMDLNHSVTKASS